MHALFSRPFLKSLVLLYENSTQIESCNTIIFLSRVSNFRNRNKNKANNLGFDIKADDVSAVRKHVKIIEKRTERSANGD